MPAAVMKQVDGADETCPVCKQSRYLNPKMSFKINPECYHRMCDSCIDRIFMSGPAPCPVAGCNKTLRKARFRKQTFADLAIERECDIRRRVAEILNKREDDFETLRAFNDYQETKEDIVWKLINREDVPAVERQLSQFSRENREGIAHNKQLEQREREAVRLEEDERVRRQEQGREELKRELAEDRVAKQRAAKGMIDTIMTASGDPEEAVRQARERVVLKKSSAARPTRPNVADAPATSTGSALAALESGTGSGGGALSFAGLKKVEKKGPEGPYDAFGGVSIDSLYYRLRDNGGYDINWLRKARSDSAFGAAGYDVNDYCRRAVFEGHAGLGIILSKEKTQVAT